MYKIPPGGGSIASSRPIPTVYFFRICLRYKSGMEQTLDFLANLTHRTTFSLMPNDW